MSEDVEGDGHEVELWVELEKTQVLPAFVAFSLIRRPRRSAGIVKDVIRKGLDHRDIHAHGATPWPSGADEDVGGSVISSY